MAVFTKITESFVLSDSKDETLEAEYKKPIVGRFEKIKPDTMCLIMGEHVSFLFGPQNKVSGDLSMEVNGDNIEINCDAIFKINIRPQHEEIFLGGKEIWTFSLIQQGDFGDDLVGDVTKGLKLKKYKIKNRNGTLDVEEAIISGVKTGSKKTDFK